MTKGCIFFSKLVQIFVDLEDDLAYYFVSIVVHS